jgi:hypothetical protein
VNAKQVATQIVSTCESLDALKLVSYFNFPETHKSGDAARVSWRHVPGSGHLHPFGSLEQYRDWVKNGEFTCILFDWSLVRASYDFLGNNVVGHSLLFWPCPILFHSPPESLEDICAGLDMCLDSPKHAKGVCDLTMKTPMRFDFDPDREKDDHPLIHLHTQFEEARLFVNEAMCFPAFMKKIFRTFYADRWVAQPEIGTLHEQEFDYEDGKFDPLPHSLQISWR